MEFSRIFCRIILFISVMSVKTYSVSYEDIHLAFSNTPKLIYTESESNPAFSGYSYTTQDLNGGESNVVFTTGANSLSRMQHERNSIKLSEKTEENSMFSEQRSKSDEANMNKQEDFNSSVETVKEEKELSKSFETNDNFLENQALLQQISFVGLPYPAFKTNLVNFPTMLPKYHTSLDMIPNNYPYDFYSQLKLPLYNFNPYTPSVPLFYQTAIPSNNINRISKIARDMKVSLKSNDSKKSHTNVTVSESSSIESRSNLESMTDTVNKISNKSAVSIDKLEFMTTSKKIEEEITNNPVKLAVTSESSIEQNTELANTEISLLMKKSTTETSKK